MKQLTMLAFSSIVSLALGNSVLADEYIIDGSGAGMHSSIHFKASHVGISSLWGRFNDLSGSFTYDADAIEDSSINVRINPGSIDTNHEARDIHLSSSDYMDVSSFPEVSFTSTSIQDLGNDRVRVNGTFTLHGVTKPITFDAVKTGEGETPFGDYRVGFEGEMVLETGDFGINAGPIEMVLAIEGIRQ